MAKNPFSGIMGAKPEDAKKETTPTPEPEKVGGAVVASGADLEQARKEEAAKAARPVGVQSTAAVGSFSGDQLANEIAQAYEVREEDQKRVHVLQELRDFDKKTGARLSRPVVQMYGVKEWAVIAPALRAQGYTIEILHHPGK